MNTRAYPPTVAELQQLELRYRRLIRFDRALWVIYAASALIPAYFLVTLSDARVFHAFSALTITSVGWFGWVIDTRLLQGRMKNKSAPYAVSAAFILSRIGIACAASYFLLTQYIDLLGVGWTWSMYWRALSGFFSAPFVPYLIFVAACYRLMFHLSVHFLLKIQEVRKR